MDVDEATRVRQGASITTSPEVLRALANDPSVTVRVSLALNPALPEQVSAMLAEDTDARVRTILSRKLSTLTPGLVLAVEPMINLGGRRTRTLLDKWTVVTADGSWSAHFEHTFAVTQDGPFVTTALDAGVSRLAGFAPALG